MCRKPKPFEEKRQRIFGCAKMTDNAPVDSRGTPLTSPSTATAPPASTIPSASTSRGTSGNRRKKKKTPFRQRPHQGEQTPATPTAFHGSTPEMNHHVFQTMAEHGNRKQFNRTMEELEMFVLKTRGFEAADMLPLVRDLLNTATHPPPPTSQPMPPNSKHRFESAK